MYQVVASEVMRGQFRILFAVAAICLAAGCASNHHSPGSVSAGAVSTSGSPSRPGNVGDVAVAVALEQVGVPYRYGGQGPSTGFDCSGLVHYSYLQAGKSLPRTTGQLWNHATPVSHGEMRAGDLLFFSISGKMQHVGLYVGDGRFVHAPSSGRTVTVASLSSDYYRQAFLRAGRP